MSDANKTQLVTEKFAKMFSKLENSGELYVEVAKIQIAEEIYATMKRLGLSQSDIAKRLKTSRAYVTKILQGTTNFTLESLVKIAQALDCQLDLKMIPLGQTTIQGRLEVNPEPIPPPKVFAAVVYESQQIVGSSSSRAMKEIKDETLSVAG